MTHPQAQPIKPYNAARAARLAELLAELDAVAARVRARLQPGAPEATPDLGADR